jgi:sterol desaturase/sphingolipid hydroxylase (fatty acid hydroxylase superfamily)
VIAVLSPLEMKYSRISYSFKSSHFITVLLIGLLASAFSYFIPQVVQKPLIGFVAPFQFFSMPDLPIPHWMGFIFCFLLIDLANYFIHRLSHSITLLWRLHKIHHSDTEVKAITGILHHPGEVLFSYILMISFYIVLGIPIVVIIAYSFIYQIHAIFSHANIKIPSKINSYFNHLIVMPDIHRIHHSEDMEEGNSNFGAIFPFWDKAFGTYKNKSKANPDRFKMGLPQKQQVSRFSVLTLLVFPIKS